MGMHGLNQTDELASMPLALLYGHGSLGRTFCAAPGDKVVSLGRTPLKCGLIAIGNLGLQNCEVCAAQGDKFVSSGRSPYTYRYIHIIQLRTTIKIKTRP